MPQVSVVIITKNEARNIIDCIASAKKISNDIIVIDSGSDDETVLLAKKENIKVESIMWQGYGHARNTGAILAGNDWIFSLDADERVTNELATLIKNLALMDNRMVYGFNRINYFGNKKMRYGSFAHDRVFRLYNRFNTKWNMFPVHEKLTGKNMNKIMTDACLIHFTADNAADYLQKITGYANLCALKYQQEGKKFVFAGRLFSPTFNFVKEYIFQLGFLDNRHGFIIAKLHATYTRKKYGQLSVLLNQEKKYSRRPAISQN